MEIKGKNAVGRNTLECYDQIKEVKKLKINIVGFQVLKYYLRYFPKFRRKVLHSSLGYKEYIKIYRKNR
jgi:hypothetical protein